LASQVGHAPATGTDTAAVTGTIAAAAAAGAGGAAAAALKAAVPDSSSAGAVRRSVDGFILEAEELLRLRSAGEGAAPSEAVRLLAAALQRGGAALPQRDAATTPMALATDLAREMVGAADACMLLWARGGGAPTVLRGRDRRGAALFNPVPVHPGCSPMYRGCSPHSSRPHPTHPDRTPCIPGDTFTCPGAARPSRPAC